MQVLAADFTVVVTGLSLARHLVALACRARARPWCHTHPSHLAGPCRNPAATGFRRIAATVQVTYLRRKYDEVIYTTLSICEGSRWR